MDQSALQALRAEVLRRYFEAKFHIALSEELDPEQRPSGHAINELRNAFDH